MSRDKRRKFICSAVCGEKASGRAYSLAHKVYSGAQDRMKAMRHSMGMSIYLQTRKVLYISYPVARTIGIYVLSSAHNEYHM